MCTIHNNSELFVCILKVSEGEDPNLEHFKARIANHLDSYGEWILTMLTFPIYTPLNCKVKAAGNHELLAIRIDTNCTHRMGSSMLY